MEKLFRWIGYIAVAYLVTAFLLNFWIGGVVLERKIEEAQHFFMMRGERGVWVEVPALKYWAEYVRHYLGMGIMIPAIALCGWKWWQVNK